MTTFTNWGGGDQGPSDAELALHELFAVPFRNSSQNNSASQAQVGEAKRPLYDALRQIPFLEERGETVMLTYRIIGPGKGYKWFAKRARVVDRLNWLKSHAPWDKLSRDVRHKLSLCDHERLDRLINCLLGIEDSWLLSSPEGWRSNLPFKEKIWKWAISLGVHGPSSQNLVKAWKSFTSHVKAVASRSLEPYPKLVSSFPFQRKGTLCPLLLEQAGLCWLSEIVSDGLQTKDQGTRIMHLVSTRGLPSPCISDIRAGLNDHGNVIAGPRPDFIEDPDRIRILFLMGKRLGRLAKSYKKEGWTSSAHLSLSNSAAMESSRRKGGRAVSIGARYGPWANEVSTVDEYGHTIFGMPYNRTVGYRRYQTMCRHVIDKGGEDLLETQELKEFCTDLSEFKHEDLMAGLDQYTGYQLLQFSFEEGIRLGTIKAKPFIPLEDKGKFSFKLDRYPHVRASPIGEPGGKVRTITVAEDWLTTLLSPYGHEMVANLRLVPAARAGLSRTYQAYEWIKRLGHYKEIDKVKDLYFLTSDLTQASEYLEHCYLRPLLRGFVEGAEIDSPYMQLCIELLTYPRVLEGPKDYVFDLDRTCRGSLMGDPGTKSALMLMMLASEEEAYLRYTGEISGKTFEQMLGRPDRPSPWRCFASAGDDHIAIGPIRYLRLIKSVLGWNGAVVSQEKAFISKTTSFFTEELVLRTPEVKFYDERPLWERDYSSHLKVEALKVRLFSPCSKVTEVRTETNPAFGKTRDLVQKLAWLDESWKDLQTVAVSRFYQRMNRFIDFRSPYIYLPKWLGGLNFVPRPDEAESFSLIDLAETIPDAIRQAFGACLRNAGNFRLENILKSYSSGTSFRGLNSKTLVEEQLRAIFEMVGDSKTESEMREILGISPEEWVRHSRKNRRMEAQRKGFIEFGEALQLFERPTYFKEVLVSLPTYMREEPKKIEYDRLRRSMRTVLLSAGIPKHEWEELFPQEAAQLKAAQESWFARQAYMEANAFSLIDGSRSNALRALPKPSLEEDFKTRSFKQREADLLCDILETFDMNPSLEEREANEKEFSNFVATWDGQIRFEPPRSDAIYIQRKRIAETLCTLQTPLDEAGMWSKRIGRERH
ncbi:RNA-dependent RNA polymerase [Beihai narna-like virus 21]|uniref:RNA-dependent RNA polymerase n=1 Tax=Beihai narna-like virus 21 TaxID=1922449 RepID=UPI00090C113B|nr:RNA-dependent RNA polymerase [Beihai narna-like virus 21]APG77156.1 RNA-dependent RNA polymerase [Beihai narna-like virus 21]